MSLLGLILVVLLLGVILTLCRRWIPEPIWTILCIVIAVVILLWVIGGIGIRL